MKAEWPQRIFEEAAVEDEMDELVESGEER